MHIRFRIFNQFTKQNSRYLNEFIPDLRIILAQEEPDGHIWWLHKEADGGVVGGCQSNVCHHPPDPWPGPRWPNGRGVY